MVYFISEQYVKTQNQLDQSIEDKIFTFGIEKAQEKFILSLVGTALYNKLTSDITNNSVAGVYKTLLEDYIAPCQAVYAYHESFPKLAYKIENTGVFKRKTDTADSVSLQEVNLQMGQVKNDAEFYSEKLIRYLCANSALFPEYTNPGNTIDSVNPSKKTFQSQLHTPKKSIYINGETGYSKKWRE